MNAPDLSRRDLSVAALLAHGYSNRDIATELKLTEQIVKNVVHSLFDKLGLWNRVELARYFSGVNGSGKFEQVRQRIDADRVRAVRVLEILDTKIERTFEEVATLASTVCGTPIALVSLADSKRHWFKAKIGIVLSEASRDISFCEYTIQQSGFWVVPDALEDPRFAQHPFVTSEPNIRFYAGAPILTEEGYALGSVCVIDHVPRELSESQLAALQSLARLALQQMELRRELLQARKSRSVVSVGYADTPTERLKTFGGAAGERKSA